MRKSRRPPKVYEAGERDRRGMVVYAEVTPGMKKTLRRLSFEWEWTQAQIVEAALEQYLASQAVIMEANDG